MRLCNGHWLSIRAEHICLPASLVSVSLFPSDLSIYPSSIQLTMCIAQKYKGLVTLIESVESFVTGIKTKARDQGVNL